MIDLLKENVPRFVEKIVSQVCSLGIDDILRWDIDHLCFRTESAQDYEATKHLFLEFSDLLIESPVNGRPIATFRLREPIRCAEHTIDVVEVPAPKPGRTYARGLEHVEVVVDVPLQELRDSHPHLAWDDGNIDSIHNPDISLALDNYVVKFHPMALENVIEWEKHPAFPVIEKLGVWKDLKGFTPRVSGSIPLGIAVETSDVDILCQADNLEVFQSTCRALYGGMKDFETHLLEKYGVKSAVVNFICGATPIQIFAQALPVERQVSNLHMLIEARLLKLGGDRARAGVRSLRKGGAKTEPAFAGYFGIEGDSYRQLLDLQTRSEKAIRTSLSGCL